MVKRILFAIFAFTKKVYLKLYNFILWGDTGKFRRFAAHLYAIITILIVIVATRSLAAYIAGGTIEIPNLVFGIAAMTVVPILFAWLARLSKFLGT